MNKLYVIILTILTLSLISGCSGKFNPEEHICEEISCKSLHPLAYGQKDKDCLSIIPEDSICGVQSCDICIKWRDKTPYDKLVKQQIKDRKDIDLSLKEINKLSNRIWRLENQNITLLKYNAMADQYEKDRDICFQEVQYLKEKYNET